jgi:tRNA-splicing endonuclease subunit Sen34
MAATVTEPFPIFEVAGRYTLYDLDTIVHVREKHRILGILTGNIPLATQQNIFNGIPLQLMPEEALLLVTNGHAFVVDDLAAHLGQLQSLSKEDENLYLESLNEKGMQAMLAVREQNDRKKANWQSGPGRIQRKPKAKEIDSKTEETIFTSQGPDNPAKLLKSETKALPHLVTPTNSSPFLTTDLKSYPGIPPTETSGYPLFAHLHSQGLFMLPGIRFGGDYNAYPGDPLRFHSHFIAVGKKWDDPIDLLDVVAGGRLGTGTKKGYLVGGRVPDQEQDTKAPRVRTFCFEWASM